MAGIIKTFFVLCLLLCIVVTATSICIASPAGGPENIRIIRYQIDDYFIPQLEGMTDYRLENKINRELRWPIADFDQPERYTRLGGNFDITFYNRSLLAVHFVGLNYGRRAAHPNKIDFGILVDLTTGTKYELSDLFKPGIDYQAQIKELIRINEARYRLTSDGENRWTWGGWHYEDFARSWRGEPFLLYADAIRIYDSLNFATGYFSGYRIPYSDLAGIINYDGPLWRALQSHEATTVPVELEEIGQGDFMVREYDIMPGDNAGMPRSGLGEPKSVTPVQGGTAYNYGDLEIIVNAEGKIALITTDNKKVSTSRYVQPGYSIETVKKRYGEAVVSSFGDYDLYEYSYRLGAEYVLRFAVKHGTETVSYISWRIEP